MGTLTDPGPASAGAPPDEYQPARHTGSAPAALGRRHVPTEREWHHSDAAQADQQPITRAPAWPRDDPATPARRSNTITFGTPLADLLDALPANIAGLDRATRGQTRVLSGRGRRAGWRARREPPDAA